MAFATTTFGPILWESGHLFAANYAHYGEKDKKSTYLAYFDSFGRMLPCSWCRFYYFEICQLMPLASYIDKEDGVSRWFYLVHDLVNKKIQFRERLCAEKCACFTEEPCRYQYRRTASSPPFAEVKVRYTNAQMTKRLPR